MQTGDLNLQVRRPSTPGANQQVLFNYNGVDGANANLTFNVASSTLNVTGNINVTQNIANAGNVLVTQNTGTGNLAVTQNTTTGNLVVSTQANTVSLNVSANISNVGNLLVTQNSFTGNLSVTTLANVSSLNVSANISNTGNLLVTQNSFTGNLTVTQNTSTGNLSVTTAANTGSLNVSGNISNTGNLLVTQNSFTGNLTITQNTITGNLIVQTRANVAVLNANGIITANATPLSATETRAHTGMANYQSVNAQTTSSTTWTNYLGVTFNETGVFAIKGLIIFCSNNSANGATGLNLNVFSNSTATFNGIAMVYQGNVAQSIGGLIKSTGNNQLQVNVATNGAFSFVTLEGSVNVTGTGIAQSQVQCSSANTANVTVVLTGNSYIKFTKIR